MADKFGWVHHQNYYDEKGRFYCKKDHKIKKDDYKSCNDCSYFFGCLQGEGVECYWEDYQHYTLVSTNDPEKELERVSELIARKKLKRG